MTCNNPECRLLLDTKVSKKNIIIIAWAMFVVIGLPVLVTGIKVWSGQEASPLRYANKESVSKLAERQSLVEKDISNINRQILDIKKSQEKTELDMRETQNDIKKILMLMQHDRRIENDKN